MKAALRISIWSNLGLLGGLIFVLVNQRKGGDVSVPSTSPEARPLVQAVATPAPLASPEMELKSFHWRQLESTNDYRVYVANLRASGCPEPTIQDIVRGDASRAFSMERQQLQLNGGGTGPWSQLREMQLVASLLGERASTAEIPAAAQGAVNRTQWNGGEITETPVPARSAANQVQGKTGGGVAEIPVPSQSAGAAATSYPLFLQNVNWNALGLDASQQAAIAQVRQQFINNIGGPNQNPNDPAYLPRWQTAENSADDQLRGLLGAQAYMGYLQQQYYAWYQPQVLAATAEGEHLTINPAAFSK
jgi:hypothetical protein